MKVDHAYAISVARAMMVKVKQQRKPHAIIIYHGEPAIRRIRCHKEPDGPHFWREHGNTLVGIYDQHALLEQVADDILYTIAGEYAPASKSRP